MKNLLSFLLLLLIATPLFAQTNKTFISSTEDDEEFLEVTEVAIPSVKESDLYGVWSVKKLVSKIATIKNVDDIIDEEEYEPFKYALSKSKFVINADHSLTMFLDYPQFGEYFLDVLWSLEDSKIVIVDKPGGALESEGILLEILVEQYGDETIFIMMEGLFYLYVEKKDNEDLEIIEEYHANGALRSTGAVNAYGQKTGEWKEYYNNGRLQAAGSYAYGEFDGKWEGYFLNNKLQYKRYWKAGKRADIWMEYYDTGELYCMVMFGESHYAGAYTIYEKDGTYKSSGTYLYEKK